MTVNDGRMGPGERLKNIDGRLDDHEDRLDKLEHWQTEIRTIVMLLKWTFGASVLGALIGLLNLLDMLARR